jgi:hypothetical protein
MHTIAFINFSDPLGEEEINQILQMAHANSVKTINLKSDFNLAKPIKPQVLSLFSQAVKELERGDMPPFEDWLICLPDLNCAAVIIVEEIIKRYDARPSILRIRSEQGDTGIVRVPAEIFTV